MNKRIFWVIGIIAAGVVISAAIILTAVFKPWESKSASPKSESQATFDEASEKAPLRSSALDASDVKSSTESADSGETAETRDGNEDENKTATEAETESESVTEAETKAEPKAPQAMTELLSKHNRTLESLNSLGCGQFITVASSGSGAQIEFYELKGSEWVLSEELSCSGFVGANGTTDDMHEGGYATPRGIFHVGDAFYIGSKPETGLATFEVTDDIYWVDDPDSSHYNKKVKGVENKDWKSAEHMIDYYSSYEYGFVIDYNTESVYNAGSAIFFHVSSSSTAGCVGTSRDMVLRYLAKLQASANPYILID